MKRRKGLVLASLALGVALLLAACSSPETPAPNSTTSKTSEPLRALREGSTTPEDPKDCAEAGEVSKCFAVGGVVQAEGINGAPLAVTVAGVHDFGKDAVGLKSDEHFVGVRTTIGNTSSTPTELQSGGAALLFKAIASDGHTYVPVTRPADARMAPDSCQADNTLGGVPNGAPVQPAKAFAGCLLFSIPNTQGLRFVTFSYANQQLFTWRLTSSTPASTSLSPSEATASPETTATSTSAPDGIDQNEVKAPATPGTAGLDGLCSRLPRLLVTQWEIAQGFLPAPIDGCDEASGELVDGSTGVYEVTFSSKGATVVLVDHAGPENVPNGTVLDYPATIYPLDPSNTSQSAAYVRISGDYVAIHMPELPHGIDRATTTLFEQVLTAVAG